MAEKKKGKSRDPNPRWPPEAKEPQVDSTSQEVDSVANSWDNIDRDEDVVQSGEEREREIQFATEKRLDVAKSIGFFSFSEEIIDTLL